MAVDFSKTGTRGSRMDSQHVSDMAISREIPFFMQAQPEGHNAVDVADVVDDQSREPHVPEHVAPARHGAETLLKRHEKRRVSHEHAVLSAVQVGPDVFDDVDHGFDF